MDGIGGRSQLRALPGCPASSDRGNAGCRAHPAGRHQAGRDPRRFLLDRRNHHRRRSRPCRRYSLVDLRWTSSEHDARRLLGPLRLRRSREENLAIRLVDGATVDDVKGRLGDADAAGSAFPVTDAAVDSLKFSTCLPKALAYRTLRERGSDREAVRACLREPIRHVVAGSSNSMSSGMAPDD